MSSDGSRPARIEWADSISTPTRLGVGGAVGQAEEVADRRQVGLVHRLVRLHLAEDADVRVVLEHGVRRRRRCGRRPSTASLASRMYVPSRASQSTMFVQPSALAMSTARFGAVDGVLAVARRCWRCSRRRWCCGCSHSRGAMNSHEEALAVEHLLDLGDPLQRARPVAGRRGRRRRRGTARRRSRASCTRGSCAAKATSLRTGGPNGSAPVLMFQGPKVKRYAPALAMGTTPGCDFLRQVAQCIRHTGRIKHPDE